MKKMKTLILSFLISLVSISSTMMNVEAATYQIQLTYMSNDSTSIPSDWNNVNSKWTVQIAGLANPSPLVDLYINGQRVYCIEPLVTTIGGAPYDPADLGTILSPVTSAMLQKVSYLGVGYKGDNSKEMRAATQLVMWQKMGATIHNIHPDIQAKMDIINQRYDRFNIKPNLNNPNPTLKGIGEANKVTITDTNGVLEDYHVYSTGGIEIRHNGNSFDVWVNDASKLNGTVTFDLIHRAGLGTSVAYQSPANHQKVAYLAAGDPLSFNIDIRLAQGSLELEKQDNYNNFVPGTKFKISYNSDMSSPIGEYITGADGKVKIDNLNPQTVYIQEVSAPDHLTVDTTIRSAVVIGDEKVVFNANNITKKGKVTLTKVDSETGNTAQGSASLLGAKYGLYAGADIVDPGNGNVIYTKDALISEKQVDANRQIVWEGLTIGSYYVKETLAAPGYNIDPTIHNVVISSTNPNEAIILRNVTSKEDVIRGDVYIVKYINDSLSKPNIQTPAEGVVFKITSKTTSDSIYIKTDKNGHASTIKNYFTDEECTNKVTSNARGALVFDDYVMEEIASTTPEGYLPAGPWDLTISEQSETLHYLIRNDDITSAIKVVKKDSTTGKTIPIANTEFRLLDKDKKVITMTTHYPETIVHETFKTNESGSFQFPEHLKYGKYYLEEVIAPTGYLKGELLEFKVTADNMADYDQPLVVEYKDDPAMGKVQLTKTNEEDDSLLAGAVFEVFAREDVITGDGTVRAVKDELVDTITTNTDGLATSKELFLGKYYAVEKQQPNGFVLSDKEYDFELKYKDQNTAVVIEEVDATNTPNQITITKVETGTDITLPGAKYRIWNKAIEQEIESDELDPSFGLGNSILDSIMNALTTYETNEDGQITLKYLMPGEYRIQEVGAPTGYYTDDTIHEFVVTEDGKVNGKSNYKVTLENAPKLFELKINKVDFYSKDPIKSKDFEFTSYKDFICSDKLETVGANIADGYALFEELRYGTYYIKETKAPTGYQLSNEVVKVEINDEGFFINDKKIESDEDLKYSIVYYNELMPSVKAGDSGLNNPIFWTGLCGISLLFLGIKKYLDRLETIHDQQKK